MAKEKNTIIQADNTPNKAEALDKHTLEEVNTAERVKEDIRNEVSEGVSDNGIITTPGKYITPDTPWFDVTKFASLDEMLRHTSYTGSLARGMSDSMYGINNRLTPTYTLTNRDTYGYIFFTRPQLNLTATNIRNVRKMYSLLTTKRDSVFRYVRCLLDPRIGKNIDKDNNDINRPAGIAETIKKEHGISNKDTGNNIIDAAITADNRVEIPRMLNNNLAFMSLLSNTITRADGWPDLVTPTYTTQAGMRGEQWSIADGYIDFYSSWDMDCTFTNIKEEPLLILFQTWLQYQCYVFEDMLAPYNDFIRLNEIDYYSRCYRLVMDESNRFVKKMSATLCFPISVPTGKIFDYARDGNKYNTSNAEINIRFRCIGADYNDNILPYEFNEASSIFNPDIRELVNYLNGSKAKSKDSLSMVKVPVRLLNALNHRCYPIINPNTLELEWYINKNDSALNVLKANGMELDTNRSDTYRYVATRNNKEDGLI